MQGRLCLACNTLSVDALLNESFSAESILVVTREKSLYDAMDRTDELVIEVREVVVCTPGGTR